MCGIVGLIKFNGEPVEQTELERLNQSIFHRGPDEAGYFIEHNAGLAMRRLSIIDLTSGSQPMITDDGRWVIVFNGEIYNYREVRQELQNLGCTFKTNSDTEVILQGYQAWGEDVLPRLNGMWGLAIYDRVQCELFLARDRLGKKQIYYALNDQHIVFGSEMKIPMQYDAAHRRLRISALPEYLTYSYIGGPNTAIEGIHILPEACWAKVNAQGQMTLQKYWEISPQITPITRSESDIAEELYDLLVDATRQRLVADVPISVMLSSGLDSSACAYILARELGAKLKTFSLGYGDKDFDESIDAGAFAKKLDMPWERMEITGEDVSAAFPDFITHCDSLQSNTAQLVYYFVNQMIHRAGFKVALNGSGGDELFAGYTTYQADTLYSYYRRMPMPLRNMARFATQQIPTSTGRVSTDYMLKKFTECPYPALPQAHAYWRTIFSPQGLNEILSPEVSASTRAFTSIYDDAYQDIHSSPEKINSLLCADLKAWLIPMLPWVDNISMAHSVELRLPFLDHRLVSLSLSLPPHFLFKGWTLKRLMKRFLKNRLPDEVLMRRKRGTHLPISRWLNTSLAGVRDHYLSEAVLNKEGLFNYPAVAHLVQEHQQQQADHTFRLWGLIIFSAWKEHNQITL